MIIGVTFSYEAGDHPLFCKSILDDSWSASAIGEDVFLFYIYIYIYIYIHIYYPLIRVITLLFEFILFSPSKNFPVDSDFAYTRIEFFFSNARLSFLRGEGYLSLKKCFCMASITTNYVMVCFNDGLFLHPGGEWPRLWRMATSHEQLNK